MTPHTNEGNLANTMAFPREREVISFLCQFGISQAEYGGPELKTAICLGLESPNLLNYPTEQFYVFVSERFDVSVSTIRNRMTSVMQDAKAAQIYDNFFTLLGITSCRPSLRKFISCAIVYLQAWTDVFTSQKGSMWDLYLKAPEIMSSREKFLFMYYFALDMTWNITGYLMLHTNNMDDYNADGVEKARVCFIRGFADIAAHLLRGADTEIITGIQALAEDLKQGNIYGICADPLGFYCRLKAIAAMCRHYYYGLDDRIIAWRILQAYPSYPDVPYCFCINPLPHWLREAVVLCQSKPGNREIAACVQDSFLNETTRDIWRYSTFGRASEYLEACTPPGDEHSSFIFLVSPVSTLPDHDITMMLARERAMLNP